MKFAHFFECSCGRKFYSTSKQPNWIEDVQPLRIIDINLGKPLYEGCCGAICPECHQPVFDKFQSDSSTEVTDWLTSGKEEMLKEQLEKWKKYARKRENAALWAKRYAEKKYNEKRKESEKKNGK